MKIISQAEKIDLWLALAAALERKFAKKEGRAPLPSLREIAGQSLGALNQEELKALESRAAMLDDLPEEHREAWYETRLEKIRGRGRARRLDENLNPSHIVEFLAREPQPVRILILRNLPPDLSRRIALFLDLNFIPDERTEKKDHRVRKEIIALVRQKFLSNFIALEDVYEPDELDGLSVAELENFIRRLGLREVAIACRGINSKEALAAFLNRFDEEDAREIALYLTELDTIRPFWVARADELVRESWTEDLPPAKVVKKIGLKLLAAAFVLRDETKSSYAAQKLPFRDVKNWRRLVELAREEYFSVEEEDKMRLDKRREVIERLAVKFSQTGRL